MGPQVPFIRSDPMMTGLADKRLSLVVWHGLRWFALSVAFCCASCQKPASLSDESPVERQAVTVQPRRIEDAHLPNAIRIHPKVISGGLPEGDAAFSALRDLGVKTIISVDGATPDVDMAHKYGLRYVHLPHGYDGIPENRLQELAKAVRDLPGLIYIHCHHGKHRSPAAAAAACIGAGFLDPASAEPILQMAGTSPNYQGLYQAAREARVLDARSLANVASDFPEKVAVPPLAEAMVALEHTHDHLKQIAAAGWKPLPEHPDIDPAHEALLLREHFTELLRLESVQDQPPAFKHYLRESEAAAQELEDELRAKSGGADIPFAKVSKACADCHQQFRDIPLAQKRR